MKYSNYQEDFWNTIDNDYCDILLRARAGSGKTFSILKALDRIPKEKHVISLAFNKSTAEELSKKVPKNVVACTLHSFGAKVVYNHYGNVKFHEFKVFNIATKMFDRWRVLDEKKMAYCYRVAKLVNFMKVAMVYDDLDEIIQLAYTNGISIFKDEAKHAIEVLKESDRQITEKIDFTDMIHIPASKNLKMRKFDYVFVDEVQDLNLAQQRIVQKIINPRGGRIIAVGDDLQAIYAFSGADANSFNKMRTITDKVKEMPLNICYRCSKAVIREAQKYVPDIEYNDDAPEGSVKENGMLEDIHGDVFVLCRNTKPLVQTLIKLLSRGIKAQIKGREIGDNIVNIIKKTNQKTVKSLLKHLEVNRVKLKAKLISRGVSKPDHHVQMIEYCERRDIIKILSSKFSTTNQLVKYIDSVFCDDEVPGVMLMTIHKAKGLEKEKVFFLKPELIPSNYATTPEQMSQEWNLMYVGITRAKKDLIYIKHPNLD